MTIELKITPRRGALLQGHDNTLEVLIQALGPAAPEDTRRRQSLNLSLVIDRSGSMDGQPLTEAKRCAARIVRKLRPDDFVSVVAYGSDVSVICPARPANDPDAICNLIEAIQTMGMTALHDGWAAGAEQAARNVKHADISRVLLLSDGCANEGLTDKTAIAAHCGQMADLGVSTSTYGLGTRFNEDLMFAMAKAGRANAYYGQTAQDLMTTFEQEFDLLQSLYARNVSLALKPADGVHVDVVNTLPWRDGEWGLPDIAYGSEAWALTTLHVPKALVAAAAGQLIELLKASLSYNHDGSQAESVTAVLKLDALDQPAYGAVAEDLVVKRRSQEVQSARFQMEASAAATAGAWDAVDDILKQAREAAAGNDWLFASLEALETYARQRRRSEFTKEAGFKS